MTNMNDNGLRNDTHDWDGTPDAPQWHDLYTPEELAAVLDVHALRVAKMHGAYSFASDISRAADCIRDLEQQIDELRSAGGDIVRKLLVSRESLSRKPT